MTSDATRRANALAGVIGRPLAGMKGPTLAGVIGRALADADGELADAVGG